MSKKKTVLNGKITQTGGVLPDVKLHYGLVLVPSIHLYNIRLKVISRIGKKWLLCGHIEEIY